MARKRNYAWKDPKGLAGAVVVWLWILIVALVATVAACGYQIYLLKDLDPSLDVMAHPSEKMAAMQLLVGIVTVLSVVVMVISGIVSLKWIYRTNANAHAMAPGLPNSPPWAVGWFFVPIASLFKPYQSMAQTWRVSTRAPGRGGQNSVLLGWWWGLWIVSGVVANLSSRIGDEKSVRGILYSDAGSIASDVLTVVMNLVFMAVVVRLSSIQVRAWANHQAAQDQLAS